MGVQLQFELPYQGLAGPFLLDRLVTVGRGSAADIAILDDGLSRVHCSVEPTAQGLYVRDLDSTNGIYADGARVKEAHVVCDSQFWIGHIRVFVGWAAAEAMPLPPQGRPITAGAGHTPDPQPAAPQYDGSSTFVMNRPPPAAVRELLKQGHAGAMPPGTTKLPGGQASQVGATRMQAAASPAVPRTSPQVQPPVASSPPVAKTLAPFKAVEEPAPVVAKTAPPFPVPAATGPPIEVTVGGQPTKVDKLSFDLVDTPDGRFFVHLTVSYTDSDGAAQSRNAWLQATQ